jgi:hypothetical protein
MLRTPEERLLSSIRKAASLVARGLLTAPEFINGAYDEFAHAEEIYPGAIAPLCEAIPDIIKDEFVSAVRASSRPNFRWSPFYIGIGPPLSDEQLRLGSDRIRAWSVELLRSFDGDTAKNA